jgi:hypothetical protein
VGRSGWLCKGLGNPPFITTPKSKIKILSFKMHREFKSVKGGAAHAKIQINQLNRAATMPLYLFARTLNKYWSSS